MAKIIVENAKVERVFETKNGWGVGLVETKRRRDGSEYPERCTAWFWRERFGIEEGDVVSLAGDLSTKVRSYTADGETRHTVDVSINNPRIYGPEESSTEPDTAWSAPAGDEF